MPCRPWGSGKNGFVPGHPQELALLGGAAGRRAGGLAEHEERGRLLLVQLRDRGDDVLVAVQDQQVVDGPDVARVLVRQQVCISKTARPFFV